jgi:hypothetical protein
MFRGWEVVVMCRGWEVVVMCRRREVVVMCRGWEMMVMCRGWQVVVMYRGGRCWLCRSETAGYRQEARNTGYVQAIQSERGRDDWCLPL